MATMTLKMVPEAAYDINPCRLFLHPMRSGPWRKLTNDREGKPKKNSDAVVGTALELASASQAAS